MFLVEIEFSREEWRWHGLKFVNTLVEWESHNFIPVIPFPCFLSLFLLFFFFGDSSEGREKKKKQNSSNKIVEFRKQGRGNEYKTKEMHVVRKRFGGVWLFESCKKNRLHHNGKIMDHINASLGLL